ncbi:hypothetical protein D081_0605 [Anaerovibrio sp. JC8]|uniref:DUF4392 domain-containing protein n=1 Tax=Anaerovibrio sp. JC8 TaxID=1240085 RepID=UPI000A0E6321|nr:DUF4392 domain-containing protein [Anaerovibrio sp. JC8]ORU00623.1 hypothetical protein D081_0605 [Anaerovibrio sp. JC8]
MTFYEKLDSIMREDPGERGLIPHMPPNPVAALDRGLDNMERVILLTGFPTRLGENKWIGETDGPLGTANIALALEKLGITIMPMTDSQGFRPFEAALHTIGCKTAPTLIPYEDTEAFIIRQLDKFKPTHLITLERPGKGRDGHYHNMGGKIIDDMLTDCSCIIDEAQKRGVMTISVGDGGNEIGMGSLRDAIEIQVPHGAEICASECAQIPIVSGVSNWWGWGICALLSLKHGQNLISTKEMEKKLIKAIVAAGSVDGCTRKNEPTIDRLPMSVHLDILKKVQTALTEERQINGQVTVG